MDQKLRTLMTKLDIWAVLGIVLYILGLMIHVTYMNKYTYTGFELIKGRYITIGFLFLIQLIPTIVFGYMLIMTALKLKKDMKSKIFGAFQLIFLASVFSIFSPTILVGIVMATSLHLEPINTTGLFIKMKYFFLGQSPFGNLYYEIFHMIVELIVSMCILGIIISCIITFFTAIRNKRLKDLLLIKKILQNSFQIIKSTIQSTLKGLIFIIIYILILTFFVSILFNDNQFYYTSDYVLNLFSVGYILSFCNMLYVIILGTFQNETADSFADSNDDKSIEENQTERDSFLKSLFSVALNGTILAPFIIACLWVNLIVYSNLIYAEIPFRIGGGKPIVVEELVLNNEPKIDFRQYSQIKIIDESAEYYYFLCSNDNQNDEYIILKQNINYIELK